MNGTSWRLLIGPSALAAAGLALFVAAPWLGASIHLYSGGVPALALHHASGIWMWFALAWLAGRMPKKAYADSSSPLTGLI